MLLMKKMEQLILIGYSDEKCWKSYEYVMSFSTIMDDSSWNKFIFQ
jgi:hypothetical protein